MMMKYNIKADARIACAQKQLCRGHRLVPPFYFLIGQRCHPLTVQESQEAIGKTFIAFELTINGGSFSFGKQVTPLKQKSWTIINDIMERLDNIHPGEVLLEEFMKPLEITAYRLSKNLEIPQTRISEILKGRRRILADTALRLSRYFGNSAKFWLGLQDDYDLEEELNKRKPEFQRIKKGKDYAAQLEIESLNRTPGSTAASGNCKAGAAQFHRQIQETSRLD